MPGISGMAGFGALIATGEQGHEQPPLQACVQSAQQSTPQQPRTQLATNLNMKKLLA
jgi:hypothetical protein